MRRVVLPEILDSLDHGDPRALANRRDLRTINLLMGNFRWFARRLREGGHHGILELGAGDGSLGLYLLGHDRVSAADTYAGLDLAPRPQGWPPGWAWHQEDLRAMPAPRGTEILLANMLLHQFKDDELEALGATLQQSSIRCLLLCEPVRRRRHLWQLSLTRALGMHPVSLHDGAISIHAGFRRDELAQRLGLASANWTIRWTETCMGANRMVCRRR